MPNATLYTHTGQQTGSVELPAGLVVERVHEHALYETVKGYLANQRQGTHKTKTRHEVSGPCEPPWWTCRREGTLRRRESRRGACCARCVSTTQTPTRWVRN